MKPLIPYSLRIACGSSYQSQLSLFLFYSQFPFTHPLLVDSFSSLLLSSLLFFIVPLFFLSCIPCWLFFLLGPHLPTSTPYLWYLAVTVFTSIINSYCGGSTFWSETTLPPPPPRKYFSPFTIHQNLLLTRPFDFGSHRESSLLPVGPWELYMTPSCTARHFFL